VVATNAASVVRGARASAGKTGGQTSRVSLAAYGYAAAAVAIVLGWIVTREYQLVDPLRGLGYWLGIVGASLMAVLLLYPVRKRVRFLRILGATRHWFRMHMFFGVLGPVLILYHSNFQFGSLNSNVALICTLLVAGSGLIGRYLHSKIYADLEGHRKSLEELANRAGLTAEQASRTAKLAPHLIERLIRFDEYVMTPPTGFLSCLVLPFKLAVMTRIGLIRLVWFARRDIRREAAKAGISGTQCRNVERAIRRMLATHLKRVRRVAEFHSYERLFSLWHVFHLPFFYILVVTALVHVLAVHMY
jgi:hypothetical protein